MRLILATRNKHKVREIQEMLGPGHACFPMSEFVHPPEVVEDAPTFAGNAIKKARLLAAWLEAHPEQTDRLPGKAALAVLADDSGLEVDALGGAPGVHSARFAALDDPGAGEGNSPDADNNAKLLRLLEQVRDEERTGRFRCVLALVPVVGAGEAEPVLFEGSCEGLVARVASGERGFGYDPLFVPVGYDKSFGELGEETKHRISHRSLALAGLKEWLCGGGGLSWG